MVACGVCALQEEEQRTSEGDDSREEKRREERRLPARLRGARLDTFRLEDFFLFMFRVLLGWLGCAVLVLCDSWCGARVRPGCWTSPQIHPSLPLESFSVFFLFLFLCLVRER